MIKTLEEYKEAKFQLEAARYELEELAIEIANPIESGIDWSAHKAYVKGTIEMLERQITDYEADCRVLF